MVVVLIGWATVLGYVTIYWLAQSGMAFTSIVEVNTIALMITSSVAGLLSIPETIAKFTEPAGECHRVGQLMEVIDDVKAQLAARASLSNSSSNGATRAASYIGMEGVKISTPDGKRVLFNNLSFTVKAGDNLLISGPSGVGKSSLLRAIAGLWPIDSGILYRPSTIGSDGVLFLSQRNYITKGTLREQIVYPHIINREILDLGEQRFIDLLQSVGLLYLKSRWYMHAHSH